MEVIIIANKKWLRDKWKSFGICHKQQNEVTDYEGSHVEWLCLKKHQRDWISIFSIFFFGGTYIAQYHENSSKSWPCYGMADGDKERMYQDIQSATTHHQCSVDRPTIRTGSISVSACNLPRRMLMDLRDLPSLHSSPFRKTLGTLGWPNPCTIK